MEKSKYVTDGQYDRECSNWRRAHGDKRYLKTTKLPGVWQKMRKRRTK